jgi:hypothetical protein
MIHYLMGAVLEYAESADPELWRRYLAVLLDGLRASPTAEALPHPAPDPETLSRMALS